MPIVRSVNVGPSKPAEWAGVGATSIDKHATPGPVRVGAEGIVTDTQTDRRFHGGEEQAVYAFAREDLDLWGARLGAELRDGQFAENLTTEGIDINESLVGEQWRIGTVLLQVCSVRTPCNDFKNWMGVSGYDNSQWVRRFTQEARPGPYLRVLEEGELEAGDEIVVVHRPDHGITVSDLFRALNLDRTLLPRLIGIEGLGDKPRAVAERYVATR
ncbi:MOSC domain-containing protein YiiM [Nocardioides albertanoniae]|uniref:MOSC domain-containing protein YiiM n=1 Tax=Nocardioides albertanoniae TaxID=1175486 RepID=A0A543A542_9ACTN|nr:MOSC domain-containing protein [Nocardioides albertanoniae]TQL67713.1 MOSC domain-containing protein YiiM [Nocardioides albertanoniae]